MDIFGINVILIVLVGLNLLAGGAIVITFFKKHKKFKEILEIDPKKAKVLARLESQIKDFFTVDDLLVEIVKTSEPEAKVHFFVPTACDHEEPYFSMIKELKNKNCKINYFKLNSNQSDIEDMVDKLNDKLNVKDDASKITSTLLKDDAKILPTNYCFIDNPNESMKVFSTVTDTNNTIFGYMVHKKGQPTELWNGIQKNMESENE